MGGSIWPSPLDRQRERRRGDLPADAGAVDGVEESEGEGEGEEGGWDGDGARRRRRGEASAASGDGARRPGRVSEPSHRSSGERRAIATGTARAGWRHAARTRRERRRVVDRKSWLLTAANMPNPPPLLLSILASIGGLLCGPWAVASSHSYHQPTHIWVVVFFFFPLVSL